MNIEFVLELMKDKGINAYGLSRITGLPRSTISKLLNNLIGDPRISTVKKIAQALEVTIEKLVSDESSV